MLHNHQSSSPRKSWWISMRGIEFSCIVEFQTAFYQLVSITLKSMHREAQFASEIIGQARVLKISTTNVGFQSVNPLDVKNLAVLLQLIIRHKRSKQARRGKIHSRVCQPGNAFDRRWHPTGAGNCEYLKNYISNVFYIDMVRTKLVQGRTSQGSM